MRIEAREYLRQGTNPRSLPVVQYGMLRQLYAAVRVPKPLAKVPYQSVLSNIAVTPQNSRQGCLASLAVA